MICHDASNMDVLKQRYYLIMKLGALVKPIEDSIKNGGILDEQRRNEILAQYLHDTKQIVHDFSEYSKQPGLNNGAQRNLFLTVLGKLPRLVVVEKSEDKIKQHIDTAINLIHAIPDSSIILEDESSFTAYCKLKSLCEAETTNSIVWIDRYFDKTIFNRYLQDTSQDMQIVLITTKPRKNASKKNKDRWKSFIDISRMFSHERTTDKYSLMVSNSIHDRWLILNNKRIYQLGGSTKNASFKSLSKISTVEASTENLDKINSIINNSTELFGPFKPKHI